MTEITAADIELSSLANPSEDDLARFHALSDAEKRGLLLTEIEKGRDAAESPRSIDALWREALKRAGQLPDHAL